MKREEKEKLDQKKVTELKADLEKLHKDLVEPG